MPAAARWGCWGLRRRRCGWGRSNTYQGGPRARIVSNDSLLSVDGVQVPNLASHVLSQAARRLAGEQLHKARPLLLETCVEVSRLD